MSDAAIADGSQVDTETAATASGAESSDDQNGAKKAEPETVVLKREEFDKLNSDLAQARKLQAQADRKLARALGKTPIQQDVAPKATTVNDDAAASASQEDLKAERAITRLALNPRYREVLDGDPTLGAIISKNPLGLLPMLEEEPVDADDAIEMVKEYLDGRLKDMKAKQRPEPKVEEVEKTPPAVSPNARGEAAEDPAKKIRENPNVESAIRDSIRSKLGR